MVAPVVARGMRRMLLPDTGTGSLREESAGFVEAAGSVEAEERLVILDRAFEVRSASPGIGRWLRRLPVDDPGAGRLPTAGLSVAAATLRAADRNEATARAAFARVTSADGGRLALYGAHVRGRGSEDGVAVIIEHASAGQMLPLLMSA